MTNLTWNQRKEVNFLVQEHHFGAEEAKAIILRPRTKVRAPTMEELEQWQKEGGTAYV